MLHLGQIVLQVLMSPSPPPAPPPFPGTRLLKSGSRVSCTHKTMNIIGMESAFHRVHPFCIVHQGDVTFARTI